MNRAGIKRRAQVVLLNEVKVGSVAKDHIFLGSLKLATLNNATDLFFTMGDHLGSSDIVTDSAGTVTEYRDYMPFGTPALEQVISDSKNNNRFTGKDTDPESTLQYYGARYLSNNLARFQSVDPVLLALYDGDRVKSVAGRDLKVFLASPQELNSYAYTANNPLRYIDPDGNTLWEVITWQQSPTNYRIEVGQAAEHLHSTNQIWRTALDNPIASSVAVGVVGGLTAHGVGAGAAWTLGELGFIGASQLPNVAQKAVDYTQRYGQNFGSRMNEAQEIYQRAGIKFDPHLLLRTAERINRGVTPEKVLDTISTGAKYYDKVRNNYSYFKDGIRVAQELNGIFKTVVTEGKINLDRFIELIK